MSRGALTVVVVSWECADHLARLAESMNGKLDPGTELIVVDNRSGDDPEAAAAAWGGKLRFERLDSNRGFGAAANVGVELARTENVLLLNPDTELLDGSVAALAEFATASGCLAGPRLLNPDGSVQPSAGGHPAGPWPWIGALAPGALQPRPLLRRTEPWRLDAPTAVAWLSGACLAGPRGLLLGFGPFDPAIHLYAEDMDLGLRASAAGVPSLFRPDLARVVHRRRGSTERRWPQGPAAAAAANRRGVVCRAYGPAAERRSWRAQRLNLRLRWLAKSALRQSAEAEREELEVARQARRTQLPPSPPGSA